MNKIFLLLISFYLFGCTNNSNNPDYKVSKDYSISYQGSGDFGVVEFNKTGVKSFVFKNDGQTNLAMNPQISNADFSIAFSLGCENVLPGKSCLVKVLFSGINKEAGTYSANLSVQNTLVPLTAQINQVPQTVYEFSFDNSTIVDNQSLGTLVGNNLKVANLKIKNNSPKTGNISSLSVSNVDRFRIVGNGCSNVQLKPGQTCLAKLIVRGDNSNNNLLSSISFDSSLVNVNFQQQNQVLTAQMMPLSSEISLGDFYEEGQYKIQVISIKNLGDGIGSIDSISLPSNYSLASNNCRSVKPNNSCLIRLIYIAPDLPKGSQSESVLIGDGDVSLVTNQVSVPNSLSTIILQINEDLITNQCYPLQISLKDNENLDFVSSKSITLQTSLPLHNDSNCNVVSNQLDPFESSKTFYIKRQAIGFHILQATNELVESSKNLNFYNPLSISQNSHIIISNNQLSLSPIGGKSPYTYEKVSGVGSVSSSGVFTSSQEGNSEIKIKDSMNQEVAVSIQIVEPLSAISSNFEILVNQNQSILGQKGLPPYTYEKVSGVGSINPSGNYISNSSGSVVLKIKDSLNQEILVSGQVYSILNIAQSNYSITTANQIAFNPTGGKSPYNFIKTSGVGEVSNLGVYTSNLVGNAQITISDSLGQSVSVSISVNTSLSIQSGNCSYAVPEQNNCQVQSSGGIGTRTYSVDKGVINSTTGEFYGVCSGINSISEQSTVTVSDSYGNQSSIVLNYPCVFSSCNQIKAEVPSVVSGQFWIDTDNDRQGDSPFLTFCDHDYEKGGWNLVAKYGNTSNNLRHWFVTSYGNLSLDTTFPNDMQISSYANKLVRRASEIKVNFNSSLNSYYTINQLTTNKNNLWNNTSSNLLIGYIGVRPTGFNTTPYAPGQPVRSHHGTYGGANGSGLTSGLSSDLSLDTVANCATYCAYRLPGIGATPAAAWGLQENNLHVYVKELYNKYGVSCADAKNRNLLNQSGTTASGNYWIDPDGANIGAEPYTVFCDMVGNNSTMNATGGEITYSGDYKIHTFRNIGTSSFSITQGSGLVEALVVAGGGAGGSSQNSLGGGGGGGAGGVLTTTSLNLSIVSPNYSVVVGQGGPSGGSVCSTGNNGSDSSFAGLVAKGGGAGAAGCGGNNVGFSGGSGGGAGYNIYASTRAGGAGTNGQGFNGGSTSNLSFAGGSGGGGATGPGQANQTSHLGGLGGPGLASSISGTSLVYGVGGRGGGGGSGLGDGVSGAANTGNGGNASYGTNSYFGGAGGSGIVIIRYKYKISN